jgi:hypothetical protein
VTTFLICYKIGSTDASPGVGGLLTNLDIAVRAQQDIRAGEGTVFESFSCDVGHAGHDLL